MKLLLQIIKDEEELIKRRKTQSQRIEYWREHCGIRQRTKECSYHWNQPPTTLRIRDYACTYNKKHTANKTNQSSMKARIGVPVTIQSIGNVSIRCFRARSGIFDCVGFPNGPL